jgi:hypothetical protein
MNENSAAVQRPTEIWRERRWRSNAGSSSCPLAFWMGLLAPTRHPARVPTCPTRASQPTSTQGKDPVRGHLHSDRLDRHPSLMQAPESRPAPCTLWLGEGPDEKSRSGEASSPFEARYRFCSWWRHGGDTGGQYKKAAREAA